MLNFEHRYSGSMVIALRNILTASTFKRSQLPILEASVAVGDMIDLEIKRMEAAHDQSR